MKKRILIILLLSLLIVTGCDEKKENKKETNNEEVSKKVDKNFEKYKEYFYENYSDDIYRLLITDVTNDDKTDMIVIEKNEDEKTYQVNIFTIKNSKVELIYEQKGADFHAGGFIDLYLYEENNEKTFINGISKMWQGYGEYGYETFKLTNDGKKEIVKTDTVKGDPVKDEDYNKVYNNFKKAVTYAIELVVTDGPSGIDKGDEYKPSVIFGKEVSDNTYNPDVEESNRNDNKIGNTSINLLNGGYFAEQAGTIFFANIDGTKIYMKPNTNDSVSIVYKTDKRISNLNVIGRYIYCNETASGTVSIVKVDRITGEGTILKTGVSSYLFVDNKYIYYSEGTSSNSSIYKMKLDGTNNTKITDAKYSFFNVNGNNLYFIDPADKDKVMDLTTNKVSDTIIVGYKTAFYGNKIFENRQYGNSSFGTRPIDLYYISEIKNEKAIKIPNTNKVEAFTIANNRLYYSKEETTDKTNLYSCNFDGSDEKLIAEYADAIMLYDVSDGYIYYFHMSANISTSSINLYRISKTDKNPKPEKVQWLFK